MSLPVCNREPTGFHHKSIVTRHIIEHNEYFSWKQRQFRVIMDISPGYRRIEMKRKLIFTALLFLIMLIPFSLFSQDFKIEDNVLVKYLGNAENVIIPEGVTAIGENVFDFNLHIIRITIPSSVTFIKENAFSNCFWLANITVDSRNSAYSSIDGVLFNKDRTVLILYPRDKQEKNYTIPASVTSIGKGAFSNCLSLTSITIPSSVTSIGNSAFSDCQSLTGITIPPSVASIGDFAFGLCLSLESITISEGVTSIGALAFISCGSLKSVTIPASVRFIGPAAFFSCAGLRNVNILAVDISIDGYIFAQCISLETIVISERVNIGNNVFPYNVKIIYSD